MFKNDQLQKKTFFIKASFILTLTLFLSASHSAKAQSKTTVRGTVKTASGHPAMGETIRIQENNRITQTDPKGHFLIENLEVGSYTLIFTGIGYQTYTHKVTITTGKSINLSITVTEDQQELQSVEVVGRKEGGYNNTLTFSGTKTATPIKEVPQTISFVTKETLEDQMAFKTSDAIKNISGVTQASYNNNDFVLRGFRANTTLVNGLRISTRAWSQNLLPYVERIEVIKGPASALFANTDPGGTINTVTKKPLDESRKSITLSTGSYDTYRSAADFTGPMNDTKTLLYRLNLAYQNAGSFRILQDNSSMVLAPSFSFIPNSRTRVNIDLVYQYNNGRLDRGQPIFGASKGTNLNSTPISFAIAKKNDYQKELNLFSTFSLQHSFSDNVSFNASYMKSYYDEDLLEHRSSNNYGVDKEGNEIPTLMGMQTTRRLRKNYIDNLTTYFNIKATTRALTHSIVIGYDHIQEKFPRGNSTYNASGYLSRDGKSTIKTYKVADSANYMMKDGMPVPNVPYFDLENPDYSISEISNYINVSKEETPSKYYVNGIYIQDQIKWDKLQLLIGLRQEYYTDILGYATNDEQKVEQKAFIPRVGIVYTPIDAVSFYGTYAQGYQPQSAGTIGDPETYGGPFDPLTSNMFEVGAKMNFFQKNLFVTASAYQIVQNNILVDALDQTNPDLLRAIGQERSRGVELELYGNILPNLMGTANFSYSKAIITESDDPKEIGQLMFSAPLSQGNVWLKYNFTNRLLNGIGIGAGANYVTERNTENIELKLPAYWVGNAALYYNVDKFKMSLNVNNLLNKTYWVGGFDYNRLYPGTPRNFMMSFGYTF